MGVKPWYKRNVPPPSIDPTNLSLRHLAETNLRVPILSARHIYLSKASQQGQSYFLFLE
jgi:hypothetical protein